MSPKSGELNSCPQVKQEQRQCITEMASHGIIKLFVTVNQNRKKQKTKTNKQTRHRAICSHVLHAAEQRESLQHSAETPHPQLTAAPNESLHNALGQRRGAVWVHAGWSCWRAPPSHACAEMCDGLGLQPRRPSWPGSAPASSTATPGCRTLRPCKALVGEDAATCLLKTTPKIKGNEKTSLIAVQGTQCDTGEFLCNNPSARCAGVARLPMLHY